MNADGSAKRQLTTSPLRDVLPAWSLTRGGNRDVYVMNADGSGAQDLTRDPADDWADTWR